MQDLYDEPSPPSAFKPIAFGAAFGLAVTAIFAAAYLIAPDLPFAGTCLLALAIAGVVAIALNYVVPARAGEDLAAMAMGETPAPAGGAAPARGAEPADRGPSKEELEARIAQLRQQQETIKRAEKPVEWIGVQREIADTLKELGMREMARPGVSRQRAGLAFLKQAASAYRKVVESRGKNRSDRHWGVAQIALAECQLVLGEAEKARDQVMTAANGFTAALEVADLSAEERRAGENGLAQAEGVLTSMGEDDRANSAGDDFF